jgi:ribosome-binding factor A
MYSNKPPTQRQLKLNQELKKIAQDYFQRESSGAAMITVTDAHISSDLKNANIFITVLPQSKEKSALDFAKRMRSDLRTDIKNRMYMRVIPRVEVGIDKGELNRQRVDELLLEDKMSSEMD